MPLTNLGFETAGASPGLAASWTLSTISSVEQYAGYGSPETAWDGFESGWVTGWQTDLGSSSAATYSAAFLSPPPAFEAFEIGWNNTLWITDIGATAAAIYDPDSEEFESFNTAWDNDVWLTELDDPSAAIYTTGGGPTLGYEAFEGGWGNTGWQTAIGSTEAALFDDLEAYEDFNEVYAPVPVTIDPTANTLIAPSHGIPNGTLVRIQASARPPANLNPELDYWVVNTATNTLQLAPVFGGSAIDIGDQGAGAHALLVDPYVYWNDILD